MTTGEALEGIAGALAIALILGCLGPSLDEPVRPYSSYGYTPEQQADHRRFERDAQRRCADDRERGENAGHVITADGAVVCTDKHGRRGKSQITIAVKTEVRP